MIKSVDFSNETIERLADGDRWETVARHVRAALVAALRELSWPRGDVQAWRGQAYAARLAALREAEKLQHPRRLSAVNVAFRIRRRVRGDQECARLCRGARACHPGSHHAVAGPGSVPARFGCGRYSTRPSTSPYFSYCPRSAPRLSRGGVAWRTAPSSPDCFRHAAH
jgi:hypothetical protein